MLEEDSRLEERKDEKPTKSLEEFIAEYVTMLASPRVQVEHRQGECTAGSIR
jgi:hypothetical protein